MPTLKELRDQARSEGIIGFSRMKKADLEKALIERKIASFPAVKSVVEKVVPERVSGVVEKSIDAVSDWVGKMRKRLDWNLKERAREKLLRLNAKIGEMLKKPEFEISETPGLGGKTIEIKGKDGYSAEGFLNNVRENVIEIMKRHFGPPCKK